MSIRNVIIGIVVILGLGLLAAKVFHLKTLLMGSSAPSTSVTTSTAPSSSASGSAPLATGPSASQTVIKVTANGFLPSTVTIKAGDSVTWTNTDSAPHQINSDPHPVHTNYPPLNTVGLLNPGDSKSLTFQTAGTYGFHDHLNPQFKGTVIVE